MTGWADRVALAWITVYAHGLGADVRDRRRHEIRSDLYEHRACVGATRAQQLEVVGRVVRGIPADLAWRATQARPQHSSTTRPVLGRLTSTLVVLLAAFNVWAGMGTLTAQGAGPTYTAVLLAAGAVAALSLAIRTTAPRSSTLLLITAATVPAVVFHWMAALFVPIVLLISVLAVTTQPRRRLPDAPR